VTNKALAATKIDDQLSRHAGMQPMSRSVGNMLFWVVILLFAPAILGAYDLGGLLDPVKDMVTKTLDMLPNVFAAFVLLSYPSGRFFSRTARLVFLVVVLTTVIQVIARLFVLDTGSDFSGAAGPSSLSYGCDCANPFVVLPDDALYGATMLSTGALAAPWMTVIRLP
jgi:hypothetical protein